MAVLLEVRGIAKAADTGSVLTEINFKQRVAEKIAIAGETGSGKSTLLKIIAGLVQPDLGEVLFNGQRVDGPLDKLVPGHPEIAYLSQHFELPKFLRVEQLLSYANTLSAEVSARIYKICEIEHLLLRKSDQLSGGERQRVALAKLLVASPSLLLLDEPFSNLDFVHKKTLKKVIRNVSEELGITTMMVSHDPHDILPWADRIFIMQHGQLIQQGSPEQVYQHPVNEYAAGLLGDYNLLTEKESAQLSTLLGLTNNEKRIFLRPENVVLDITKNGLPAKITQLHFLGSFLEIEVDVHGIRMLARTEKRALLSGEGIFLRIDPKHVWRL